MNPAQARGVKLTVAAVLAFIIVIVAGFVYRIQQPRVMTAAKSNPLSAGVVTDRLGNGFLEGNHT